jgi:hypothetical protein
MDLSAALIDDVAADPVAGAGGGSTYPGAEAMGAAQWGGFFRDGKPLDC